MAADLQALVVFAFVTTVTPGPNNVLLWASGLRFGFRDTVPQVAGTALGIGVLAVGVAVGIGAVVAAVPAVELSLKVAGSAYLLWLAFQLAGSPAARRADLARPLTVRQAVAFQFLNAKAWLFALAAMATFRPALGSAIVAATMTAVTVPTAALWAAGGTALHRHAAEKPAAIGLGALLAGSIALIWV